MIIEQSPGGGVSVRPYIGKFELARIKEQDAERIRATLGQCRDSRLLTFAGYGELEYGDPPAGNAMSLEVSGKFNRLKTNALVYKIGAPDGGTTATLVAFRTKYGKQNWYWNVAASAPDYQSYYIDNDPNELLRRIIHFINMWKEKSN